MATAGDPNVVIAGVTTASDEIRISGLAPAPITYGAAPGTGNFHDGIRIWSGSGADTIAIDDTHARESLTEWTVTWLNTGLGDDAVTVDLDAGEDGFFVLDTQGAYQNRLHLAGDLRLGDLPLPADTVVVRVNGTIVAPDRYVVDYAANTIGLLDSFTVGATVTVAISRFALVSAAGDGTTARLHGRGPDGDGLRQRRRGRGHAGGRRLHLRRRSRRRLARHVPRAHRAAGRVVRPAAGRAGLRRRHRPRASSRRCRS